jgi:hypothetical protein
VIAPSRDEIRSLCTDQSFQRGVGYYNEGRVLETTVGRGQVTATVRGTHDYDVVVELPREETDTHQRGGVVSTHCSCPYDYAGVCKHVVATLLELRDRDEREADSDGESDTHRSTGADIETVVEQTAPDALRRFLLGLLEDDREARDRFLAFVGEASDKRVPDYKQEIDKQFERASNRRGLIEYGTRIDLSQYDDLAETHRETGDVEQATTIYRAVAEAIRENLDRIDDSGGHYGYQIERAVEAYAETVAEADIDHAQRRDHIEYLFEESIDAEFDFGACYDDALWTVCTTTDDYRHWLRLLDDQLPDVSLDPEVMATADESATVDDEGETAADESESVDREPEAGGDRGENVEDDAGERRPEAVLHASDFTGGPLDVDDFTGGTLDIAHLTVGPLKVEYFVGDAFEQFHVDDQTTVEEHTAEVQPVESKSIETGVTAALRNRNLLSTYAELLAELGEGAALSALYEEIYLEDERFCEAHARRLMEAGEETDAIEVVENGIATFGFGSTLGWLAAELYEGRRPDDYRETLRRLFVDSGEFAAYDDLREACSAERWESVRAEIERSLREQSRERLIELYVHEDDLDAALSVVLDSDHLALLRRYRSDVADADPEAYFEAYCDRLRPFAAGNTGRRHYRRIADHLEQMRGLVSESRFESFVDSLKEEHSNRPAFLDELQKAGF